MTTTPTHADTILVSLGSDRTLPHFLVRGGSLKGGDKVHRIISSWPGWKRSALPARIEGGPPCSCFTAPLLPSTALPLFGTKELRVSWDSGVTACYREAQTLIRQAEWAQQIAHGTLSHGYAHHKGPLQRQPMPHQQRAISSIISMQDRAILADDMGLGKTSTALWSLQGYKRILIICPSSVKWNWSAELDATLGDANSWPRWIIDGTPKQRANIFAELASLHLHTSACAGAACIINYDKLTILPPEQLAILASFVNEQALICDESHYLKSRKAQRTMVVMNHLAPKARARLLLTGTPIRNTIEDLWTQLEIVAPGCYTSYHDFMARHAVMVPISFGNYKRPVNVVRGQKNVDVLNRILNCYQIRRKKEDVLDLPPKIHTYPRIEMEGPWRKVYNVMKEWATVELEKLAGDGEKIDLLFSPQAQSFVNAFMRCEQLAQGFLGGVPEPYMSQVLPLLGKQAQKIKGRPGELIFPDHPKLVWLRETIDTIVGTGHQVVVFGRFNAPLQWLSEHYNAPFLNGSLSSVERQNILEEFQRKQHDIFFCQVKIAEGFNLTTARDEIFLSRDWSPAVNHQAEDRCHRIGQKGTVNIQIPIVMGTVEELVHRKLIAKDADAQQALRSISLAELKEALA